MYKSGGSSDEIEAKRKVLRAALKAKEDAAVIELNKRLSTANSKVFAAVAEIAQARGLQVVVAKSAVWMGEDLMIRNGTDLTQQCCTNSYLKRGKRGETRGHVPPQRKKAGVFVTLFFVPVV